MTKLVAAFLALFPLAVAAADPIDVYLIRYLSKSEQKGTLASGADIATAQDLGRQAGGTGAGAAAGAIVALGSMVATFSKRADPEEIKYALVVGLDKRCEPVEISFPYRNWSYQKDGTREEMTNSMMPMRWFKLLKNEQGENVLSYYKPEERGAVRKNPCWSKYLEQWQATEKKGKFDPEAWYQ